MLRSALNSPRARAYSSWAARPLPACALARVRADADPEHEHAGYRLCVSGASAGCIIIPHATVDVVEVRGCMPVGRGSLPRREKTTNPTVFLGESTYSKITCKSSGAAGDLDFARTCSGG